MKAVILAGGFGSRLQSVVSGVPKPLAPVASGKTFLDVLLRKLAEAGFDRVTLCLHYLHEMIEERYGNGEAFGMHIDYSVEKTALGTGGAIGLLRERLKERFFIFNGDTYLDLNYRQFEQEHIASKASVSMALSQVVNANRYGRVQLDDWSNIVHFAEKDPSAEPGLINAGVYLAEPDIFRFIPEGAISLEADVLPALLQAGQVIRGYARTAEFIDIGIPEDYHRFVELQAAKYDSEDDRV